MIVPAFYDVPSVFPYLTEGLIRPPLPELTSLGPVPEFIDFDFEPTWKEGKRVL